MFFRILCGICYCHTLASAGWHPERLHHVDSIGHGHLFRGSAPVENGSFVFDDLRLRVQQQGKAEGNVTIPEDFVLVVISFLGTIKSSEKAELKVETDWFAASPPIVAGSKLIHWPIIGDVTSPSIYPKSLCRSEAKKYASSHDAMPNKVSTVHSLLTSATTPTVVYFHCDAGMDRTGEMYGDYSMMFRNQTCVWVWVCGYVGMWPTGGYVDMWVCGRPVE